MSLNINIESNPMFESFLSALPQQKGPEWRQRQPVGAALLARPSWGAESLCWVHAAVEWLVSVVNGLNKVYALL